MLSVLASTGALENDRTKAPFPAGALVILDLQNYLQWQEGGVVPPLHPLPHLPNLIDKLLNK
jgi:hypothetical protein